MGGGGQKFLLNRLQAVGTHGAGNTASGPMVTQPMPDVQHVLGRVYTFFTLFGYYVRGGGGPPKGLVHNLLMPFFTPDS